MADLPTPAQLDELESLAKESEALSHTSDPVHQKFRNAIRKRIPALIAAARRAVELEANSSVDLAEWRARCAEANRCLDQLAAENEKLSRAIATPEVYAGIISEVVERERDQLAAENARLRAELAASEQELKRVHKSYQANT